MRGEIQLIRKFEQKKREAHRRFLTDLSTRLLPKLFSELQIIDYQVEKKFLEPKTSPGVLEICPDLIVVYRNHSSNLLIVEAKASMSIKGSYKLEQQISYMKHFCNCRNGLNSLYWLLEREIPTEILASYGVIAAGVYATKQGGFRIYRKEKLR